MTTNAKYFDDSEDTPYTTLRIFESTAIDSILAFSRFKVKCSLAFQQIRNNFFAIDWICVFFEIMRFWMRYLFQKLICRRVEPLTNSWVSVYFYDFVDNSSNESQYPVQSSGIQYLNAASIVDIDEFKSTYFEAVDLALQGEPSAKNISSLIFARLDNTTTIVRRIENSFIADAEFSAPKKSDAFFLYVDYKFADELTISIEIPRSHFVVGNDLLSREYIARHLEYFTTARKWQFSGKYTLEIADIYCEKMTLNETQWVRLTEDGYVVLADTSSHEIAVENVSDNHTNDCALSANILEFTESYCGANLDRTAFEYYDGYKRPDDYRGAAIIHRDDYEEVKFDDIEKRKID